MIIKIQQAENSIERVNDSVISNLYNAHVNGDISQEVDNNNQKIGLIGSITADNGYSFQVSALNSAYPRFHCSVTNEFLYFEDPNMVTYLNGIGIGSNGGITNTQAAAATRVAISVNTTVTKFNELKYFTNITESRGGLSGSNSGYVRFTGWTALEEVDISNFTSLGHSHAYANEDTFQNCTSLKKVTASNKLTILGFRSFYNCQNLENFIGLEGEITLYGEVFYNCVKLPQSFFNSLNFKLEGSSSLRRCSSLSEITLSSSQTQIPNSSFFDDENLTTVNLLGTLTSIENEAFRNCSKLSNINISSVTQFGNYSFLGCGSLNKDVSTWSNVMSIGNSAFSGCSLLSGIINFPSIISLGSSAFQNTKINKIQCLGKLSSIPESCFKKDQANYTALTEVYLPYECTTISKSAFESNNSLTTIKQYSDSIDNWIEGQTPASGNMSRVTTIEQAAFYYCTSLSNIDLSNVTTIRKGAFKGCTSLTGTIDLSNISELGIEAFQGCSGITGVTGIGNNTTIPPLAFSGCSISTLDFGNNVTVDGAFKSCQSLTSIRFRGTGTIQGEAFYNCANLQSIIFDGDVVVMRNSFVKCSSVRTLDLSNISEASLFVPLSGTVMGCQFAEMNLTSVILNPNITKLPPGMFGYSGTNNLVLNITIPAGVTEIGAGCFYACHANITMLSSTPPTLLGDTPLFRVHSVKVPYGSLAAYQSAAGWSNYSAIISESSQS